MAVAPGVQEAASPSGPSATSAVAPQPRPDEEGSSYGLPIFGAEAIRAGANLPLPIGISIIGQYQREDIRAHNLQVGLGGGPLLDASFVGFNSLKTRVRNLIFRGDMWLFPFLNLYGIAGESWSSTQTSLRRPIILNVQTDSQGTTLGFGATLAYGIEGYGFVTLDANLTWADQEILSSPQRTLTVTPRVGHRWVSEARKDRSFSLWIGVSMEEFENASAGSIPFGSTLPAGSGGITSLLPSDYGAWAQTLTPAQRQAVSDLFAQLIALQSNPNGATARAQFNVNINPAKAWNLVVGGEMDLNQHWQLIGEGGLLGARTTVSGNICYRFGI